MNRISILKRVDALLGTLLAALLPAPRAGQLLDPRRFLLIRPGGIGDAVLLVPAILALKRRYPQAEITVLAERRNAAAFSLCDAVSQVLLYDTPSHLLRALRGRYDVAIDTEQWHRLSAVIARLSAAPLSIGFATNNRSRLFSHRIPYSHDDYERESFLRLLGPLQVTVSGPEVPFLSVPEQAAHRAAQLLPPFPCRPFVTIFPGASIPERRWGAARFAEVAGALGRSGVPVVVVGGEDDAADGETIVAGCGGVNLAGKTNLAESAAVIARSALLISGDSGVLHLAVGLGVPTVSLFGPGIQAKWGPKGEGHLVLNQELSCSPCTRFGTTPPCPIAARCLQEIEVGQVLSAALRLLTQLRS